ncbi:tRNA pseudouridine(38-40) synthase TruA [Robiginitomaculum antarcticum]|uniref:tRNA pseudouridine(38-40) synthase TruA n=1 Tax=Robiginitomaculum antarcticum TaxID=437507 RepID=UPI00038002C5|nr:tRNA pseudouridine(38-40) synthase TruA [Robiginitomaculum antarcticum]
MPRYALTIEYDGGPYFGWQRQEGLATVQGAIETAATKIAGKAVDLYGSGRTDAGVHALAQIAHIDWPKEMRADKLRDALNYHLGDHPIAVLNARAVDDDFHARFDATAREYLYRICPRRPHLALEAGRVWRVPYKVDADIMHEAAQALVGPHDFTTFRDGQCQAKSPEKTLDKITVLRVVDEVHITVKARSFLHKQVRSIVGTLNEVGRGKWPARQVGKALAAKDRTACGPVAPPDGLYLVKVAYGD